ncbi:hypothetical protein Mal52_50760 [Symmachiella dynata]|uniref:Uncharacterized protein n=1 Tax=Symmachiella dynata TaxID=2527995 RepID=A0A517ZVS4_9PLAN|nr:hypothetical protein [Symmachiella dynata]QDU46555.1 hypothetical protein Mal52_50760 [Symmachiella dynata]
MKPSELNRRDFSKFTVAAFGGMVAGTAIGCGGSEEAAPSGSQTGSQTSSTETPETGTEVAASEKHVCRGLNTCKGKGADGKNDCAGQGTCATAKAHTCHTQNACKNQGGCGETAGKNACEGKGECAVPLMDGTWEKVRTAFEAERKAAGEPVGAAPAKG